MAARQQNTCEMARVGQMLSDEAAEGHHNEGVLSEIREIISQEVRADVKEQLAASPAFCVSLDEKAAKLVVLASYLDVR